MSTTITFVFAMFILRPIRLLSSDSSYSICRSSCGVSVHKNMSSSKRRLIRNYPSIFTPLFSPFNLQHMLSSVAVKSLGEMVLLSYSSLDPAFLTLFVQIMRCSITEVLYIHCMYFMISIYTSSIPCSCNYVNIDWVCTESNAFS